jgi:hypothetical protein
MGAGQTQAAAQPDIRLFRLWPPLSTNKRFMRYILTLQAGLICLRATSFRVAAKANVYR